MLIIPPVVVALVDSLSGGDIARWLVLLSPSDVLDGANAWIFGAFSENPVIAKSSLPGPAFAAAAVVLGRREHRPHDPPLPEGHGMTVERPIAALAVEHVSRWYGNVVAVNDISFALGLRRDRAARAERRGQVDPAPPDGRAARPSAGKVLVEGQTAWARPAMYARIGLVPERESVHGFLSGLDFAILNARLQGLADPVAAATRAIETVELTEAAGRPISTYSKGMRQRAKLAGALVHDPTILLLDEPFNGMDPRQRLHMMGLLRTMAAEGRTILFSSHILEEVERVADSILVVYAGRLAAAGDFRSIRRLMTDRPHTFRDPVLGRPAPRGRPPRRPDGLRRGARHGTASSVRTSDFAAFTRALAADRARRRRSRSSRSARPTTRSRASSATWCSDERVHDARSTSPSAGSSAAAGCC